MPAQKLIAFIFFFSVSLPCFAAPATPALPEVKTYGELLHAIREARAASQRRVETAVSQEKVREAWEIGKLIDAHVLLHKERADYGQQVLKRLSEDLGTSRTELYYMLEFARAYPIVRPGGQLSWGHYEALLSLNDPKERNEWEKRTEKEKWTKDRLKSELRKRAQTQETPPENPDRPQKPQEKPLTAAPGKLFTYRVVKAVVGPLTGQLVLDLGFSNYLSLGESSPRRWPQEASGAGRRGVTAFHDRDIVAVEKGKLKMVKAGEDSLFTYEADVFQVIDGDTIRAVVDLGFKFSTVQTLRLRGLDAPEIESAEGKEAKAFVEKILKKARGSILIKTVKSDKYDRYLADVWVGETYLNQKLIDEGLAVRVSE